MLGSRPTYWGHDPHDSFGGGVFVSDAVLTRWRSFFFLEMVLDPFLPGFTGFHWVLLGFTGFSWVLLVGGADVKIDGP